MDRPTVWCPGCLERVEIEYMEHSTLDGEAFYAVTQTEHAALLAHVDRCPNITGRP